MACQVAGDEEVVAEEDLAVSEDLAVVRVEFES